MSVYDKNNCSIIAKHEVKQWSRVFTHPKGERIHISNYRFIGTPVQDFSKIFPRYFMLKIISTVL